MPYIKEKGEIAYFMRRLYDKGLTTTSGGNISYRTQDEKMLLTPSGTDKARIKAKDIAMLDLDGSNLTPRLKPSIEYNMHISVYQKNKNVNAIIHAHPVFASAFSASKKKINCCLIAESRAILKDVAIAPYALMGTEELAAIVSDAAIDHSCILLENHGVLATGNSLLAAFDKIEVLESAARMTVISEILNDKKELTGEQMKQIDRLVG
jgi:L-fuculose-phosphate aldolase